MDPISASTFNLNNINDRRLSKISISNYEEKNWKNLSPQIFGAVITTFGHLAVGISLSYSAILLPQLSEDENFKSISESSKSWIASVFVLVTPISSIMTGYIMDRIGRINTLRLSTIPGMIGWISLAVAWNFEMIIVGRIFTGLAAPLITNPAIVYVTEISRKDMRGSLLSLGPVFVSLGIMLSYLKGWLMNWKTVAWTCNIYIIFLLVLLFLVRESPAWLVSKGRYDDAKKSLEWLHRYQPQPQDWDESFAELQLKMLRKDQDKASTTKTGNWRAFLKPTGYKPMLIILGLFVFQQYAGIYTFLFYSVSFFEDIGTSLDPYIASILIGCIRLAMSLVGTWLQKKYNRRTLVIASALGMAICTAISGFSTYLIKQEKTTMTWIPIVFLLLYVMASMTGLLSIPWTMTAELFPLEIRSMAYSSALAIANIIMFTAIQSYVSLKHLLGGVTGVQWFFSAMSVGALFYAYLLLPETHGKKLTEIEEYFRHHTIYTKTKKEKSEPIEKEMQDILLGNP